MGKVVRDGKAYRAMNERLDPWNKEYYNAKGMKKKRYKEMQWELRNIYTYESNNAFLSIQKLLYRILERFKSSTVNNHLINHDMPNM